LAVSPAKILLRFAKVEEVFEARLPRYEAPISELDGVIRIEKTKTGQTVEVISDEQ